MATPPFVYEQPRGCFTWVGLGMLAVAVLGAVAAVLGTQGGDLAWLVASLVFLLACLPPGLWFWLGREGVTVDAAKGTVRQWRTAVVTLKDVFHSLADFPEVSIVRERVRGVEDLSYLYHVQLWSPAQQVEIMAHGNYEVARAVAVPLSEHTRLPLTDRNMPPRRV
jgi:hypothetical protein